MTAVCQEYGKIWGLATTWSGLAVPPRLQREPPLRIAACCSLANNVEFIDRMQARAAAYRVTLSRHRHNTAVEKLEGTSRAADDDRVPFPRPSIPRSFPYSAFLLS